MKRIGAFSLLKATLIALLLQSACSFSPSPIKIRHNFLQVPSTLSTEPSTTLRALAFSSSSEDASNQPVRTRIRKMTGFSLTALRKTLRLATGISLTAIYASTVATTGVWIRQTMKVILSIFPPQIRYFLQPFLILYYAPLFILRNLTGPTRKRALQTHESVLEGWKEAIHVAEEKSTYWPVSVSDDGYIEKAFDDVDVNEAVVESVQVSFEEDDDS